MASRKKSDADLRTVDMFSGRTKLEELAEKEEKASASLEEEERTEKAIDLRTQTERAEDCAIRWLGLDAFHEGDDIKVAVDAAGHAVIVLVATYGPEKVPYGTSTFKLSRDQWEKLKTLVMHEA